MLALKIFLDIVAAFLAMQVRYNFSAALRNRKTVLAKYPDPPQSRFMKRFVNFWTAINGLALVCFMAAGIAVWIDWRYGLALLLAPIALFLLTLLRARNRRKAMRPKSSNESEQP